MSVYSMELSSAEYSADSIFYPNQFSTPKRARRSLRVYNLSALTDPCVTLMDLTSGAVRDFVPDVSQTPARRPVAGTVGAGVRDFSLV